MIEGTPGKPYGCLLAHFNIVEANMRYRREEAQNLLPKGELVMSLTSFPRYGLFNIFNKLLTLSFIRNIYIYTFIN